MGKTLIYNRKLERTVAVPDDAVESWTSDPDWSVAPKSGPKTENVVNEHVAADAETEPQEKKS